MSEDAKDRPEYHVKRKAIWHYNSEPSQESELNRLIRIADKRETEIRKQIERMNAWTDEDRARHNNNLIRKELIHKYINMKLELLDAMADELYVQFIKSMEENPRRNPLEKFAKKIAKYRQIESEYRELMKALGFKRRRIYRELLLRTAKQCPQIIRYYDADTFTLSVNSLMLPLNQLTKEDLAMVQKNLEKNPEVFLQ